MKRNNKICFLILLTFLLVFVMVFLTLFNKNSKVIGSKEIPISFEITSGDIGFNLEGEILNFGKIPLGGQADRALIINNDLNEKILIKLYFSDSIQKYIKGEYNLYLFPLETRNVSVSVNVPQDSLIGVVNGSVSIVSFSI